MSFPEQAPSGNAADEFALVVCRTAAEERAVALRQAEGRCRPKIDRLFRLNVVVVVDHQCEGALTDFSGYERTDVPWLDCSLEAGVGEKSGNLIGARIEAVNSGADGRDRDEVRQVSRRFDLDMVWECHRPIPLARRRACSPPRVVHVFVISWKCRSRTTFRRSS